MPTADPGRTTRLLNRYGGGDRSVEEELLASVYEELRSLAEVQMRGQPANHTLQPTALLHEAWMRLARQSTLEFDARAQFYRLASQVMRSVLVDHARKATRKKRGGDLRRISFEESARGGVDEVDLVELDECLEHLERLDPDLARVVEMRFFGGLSHPEIADALGLSLRKVERTWRIARAWLYDALRD